VLRGRTSAARRTNGETCWRRNGFSNVSSSISYSTWIRSLGLFLKLREPSVALRSASDRVAQAGLGPGEGVAPTVYRDAPIKPIRRTTPTRCLCRERSRRRRKTGFRKRLCGALAHQQSVRIGGNCRTQRFLLLGQGTSWIKRKGWLNHCVSLLANVGNSALALA
jgi:hypothetical protein